MKSEVFYLSDDRSVSLTSYRYIRSKVLRNLNEEWEPARRPAVIVCPGGAYTYLADREGEPVALSFMQKGYDAFVLRYSLGERSAYPSPLDDISRAVWFVRSHADEWEIDPDHIAVCGFSAGGHLCSLLGTQWNTPGLCQRLGIPEGGNRPNAMIMCYATTGEYAIEGSAPRTATKSTGRVAAACGAMLSGKVRPETVTVNYVSADTAPAFIWQGREDFLNVLENIHFAEKMYEVGAPFELHIFGNGSHGMSLCMPQTSYFDKTYSVNMDQWFPLCVNWLNDQFGF